MKRKVIYLAMVICMLYIAMAGCRSKKEVSYNKSVDHRVVIDKESGLRKDSMYVMESKTIKIRKRKRETTITESTTVSYPVDSITGRPH